jgi:hypothetical protein
MVIDHSRHAFQGADATESLPVRSVSKHILLRMIVRRSSNTCFPLGETAFHVGSILHTDVATPSNIAQFYRHYLPFQCPDQTW